MVGGSIAGCATAALLHRAGHDVIVFERSGSDLVSRGAGIGTPAAVWQEMMARGLIDEALPAFRIGSLRFVTRGSGAGQPRWLGDVRLPGSSMLVNWAHLYRWLRRGVPDELYRESDLRADPLGGCDLLRVGYQGGHGVLYYIPGPGPGAEPGKRLLTWGYYLQVPQGALSLVLVDDHDRQQSSSVPSGKVHPRVRAGLESRLADLLPPVLSEVVQQSASPAIQAIYSVAPRGYARDRVCLAGDAGAVFPPFTSSGVLKAVANATSLADALAGTPAVDDALRRWSQAQLQIAAQVMPFAEYAERSQVLDMPDLAAMPTAATSDWLASAYSGFVLTLPGA